MRTQADILKTWDNASTKVSICCVTFNHENFIEKTLIGFLNQHTNFPIEVLIHDDASTDNTPNIISKYANSYPDIIKPIIQNINQYSLGIRPNIAYNLPRCSGNYVAFCDGDDYWIEPYKLQKQVDFLNFNSEFSGCAHNTKVIYEDGYEHSKIVVSAPKSIYCFEDFIKGNAYFHSSSMVFRRDDELKEVYESLSYHSGDWFRLILFSNYGKIKYLDEVMSVYRTHPGGVWSLLSSDEQKIKNLKAVISFDKFYSSKYQNEFAIPFCRSLFNIYDSSKDNAFLSKFDREELIAVSKFLMIDRDNIQPKLEQYKAGLEVCKAESEQYKAELEVCKTEYAATKNQLTEMDGVINNKNDEIFSLNQYVREVHSSKAWKIMSFIKAVVRFK